MENSSPQSLTKSQRLEAQLKEETKNFKKVYDEYKDIVRKNQLLETQLHENTMVLDELQLVEDENIKMYKITGHLMIETTLGAAKEIIDRRMKFIDSEVIRNKDLIQKAQMNLEVESTKLTRLEEKHRAAREREYGGNLKVKSNK